MDKLGAIETGAELWALSAEPTQAMAFRELARLARDVREEMVSRRQLAEWCVAARNIREESWTDQGNYYRKTTREAVAEVVPEPWQTVVYCLLTAGYAEVWNWCAEQGVELGQG